MSDLVRRVASRAVGASVGAAPQPLREVVLPGRNAVDDGGLELEGTTEGEALAAVAPPGATGRSHRAPAIDPESGRPPRATSAELPAPVPTGPAPVARPVTVVAAPGTAEPAVPGLVPLEVAVVVARPARLVEARSQVPVAATVATRPSPSFPVPGVHAVARPSDHAAPDEPPVQVHIGRLEVRANLQTAAPPAPATSERSRPSEISLTDYLRGERRAR